MDGMSHYVRQKRNEENTKLTQIQVVELLLHRFNHIFSYAVLKVELFVIVALFSGAVPSDGRDVEHPAPEFDERPSLFRDAKTFERKKKARKN